MAVAHERFITTLRTRRRGRAKRWEEKRKEVQTNYRKRPWEDLLQEARRQLSEDSNSMGGDEKRMKATSTT